MAGYEQYATANIGGDVSEIPAGNSFVNKDWEDRGRQITQDYQDKLTQKKEEKPDAPKPGEANPTREFQKIVMELAEGKDVTSEAKSKRDSTDEDEDEIETFNESTYNKKLQKLKSQFGEASVNADSVV